MKAHQSLSVIVVALIAAFSVGCSKSSPNRNDSLQDQRVSTNGIKEAVSDIFQASKISSNGSNGAISVSPREPDQTVTAATSFTVNELASQLSAADFNTRITAAQELFKLGSNAAPAVATIGWLLETEPDKVHDVMLGVLEHCPSEAQTLKPTLAKYLTSSNINLRMSCARTLWVLDHSYADSVRPVANTLLRLTDDTGRQVEAASLLWRMDHDPEEVVPTLTTLLTAPATAYDYRTIRLLGQIGPSAKEAVPALQDWLKSRRARDNLVTNAAVAALQQIEAKP